MAALVFTNGLRRIGVQASQATCATGPTYSATRFIQTLSIDDQASAFINTDLSLNRSGGLTVTNEFDQALNTNTRAGSTQIVSHSTTIPTGSGNFTIRRIALHDDTATNVTTSSETLVAGIDGQSLTKTSDFTMTITVTLTYA